jgi:hypothetical protein
MHRSGTSAVTGLITMLGLHGPSADDLYRTGEWNERGNQESATLSKYNEGILRSLGGDWSAPVVLEEHWEKAPAMAKRRPRASALLNECFGQPPFVWKDPRNCLLLPFWREQITVPDAAVFVYRSPLEVAGSIKARNGYVLTHCLALWERYVRAAAANLDGIPTLVVGFDRVLNDPAEWSRELVGFLGTVGVATDDASVDRALEALDSSLRHQRPSPLPGGGIHSSQRQILDALESAQGIHLPWSAPDLGDEPAWVEDVLAMRRELVLFRREHDSSRLARLGDRLRR